MTQGTDRHQRRANQLTIIGIVVGIIGVIGTFLAIPGDDVPPVASLARSGASAEPAATSAEPVDEEPPDVAPDSLAPGTCLSSEAAILPCDVPHIGEVYASAAPCSEASLLAFLGGVTDLDVLRSDLTVTEQPGGACAVEVPEGTPVTRSLSGVLADGVSEDHSPWLRRCFDGRSEQDVDCSRYHTGEYVWERRRDAAEAADCSVRASEYLGTSIGPLFRTLDVEDLSTGEVELCRIVVKGSNSLVGSIRNIGSRAIPLAPS